MKTDDLLSPAFIASASTFITSFDSVVGIPGPQGDKGDKGDKPTKGVDYWTPEDQRELAEQAAELVEIPIATTEAAGTVKPSADFGVSEDGTLTIETVDGNAVKMRDGIMLPAYLDSKQDIYPVKQAADSPLIKNTQYFLGTVVKDLTISFPAAGDLGDMVYISYALGSLPPNVNLDTDNAIGLDNFVANITNAVYEIAGVWNGSAWVVAARAVRAG